MAWPTRARTGTILVVVAIVVLGIGAWLVVRKVDSPPSTGSDVAHGIASDVAAKIPSSGAELVAQVVTPDGSGHAPLVVMPAPWGTPGVRYDPMARALATDGFVVVAYGQRGFGGSTGHIDFAGASTQLDARHVIDWALQHTRADPDHIGMAGISLGAGVSLLTAAHDPRVKAVVAMSTWTDFGDSFDRYDTPHIAALAEVVSGKKNQANFDPGMRSLFTTLHFAPRNLGPILRAMSPTRSPADVVAELNKNRPAIMLANGFEDSIFGPAQLISFYNALTTPKRLELAPGDHGGPEWNALRGAPDVTFTDARHWLAHYLKGAANNITQQGPISLRDIRTGQVRTLSSWPTAGANDRIPLQTPGTGGAQSGPAPWSAEIQAGTASGATTGRMQFLSSSSYDPSKVALGSLKPAGAVLWTGLTPPSGPAVVGSPAVHLDLASSADTATVVLYLYDESPNGTGTLMGAQSYTATGLVPDQPRPVTIDMQPLSWQLPSGHHLALVIGSVDPQYQSLSPAGSTIKMSSTTADPAWLSVPTSG